MGIMKRIVGWRTSGNHLSVGVKVLAGLTPYVDPDELREQKRLAAEARKEAREERLAIQAVEASIIPPLRKSAPRPPEVIPARPVDPARARRQAAAFLAAGDQLRADFRESARSAIRAILDPPALPVSEADDNHPAPAAEGWYRVGETFYQAGAGPYPRFAESSRPPAPSRARVQGTLF